MFLLRILRTSNGIVPMHLITLTMFCPTGQLYYNKSLTNTHLSNACDFVLNNPHGSTQSYERKWGIETVFTKDSGARPLTPIGTFTDYKGIHCLRWKEKMLRSSAHKQLPILHKGRLAVFWKKWNRCYQGIMHALILTLSHLLTMVS